MAYAYCYRSGHIEIGQVVPDGALPLARGRRRDLEKAVCAKARHARDGDALLVPGIPEARDSRAAYDAYERFRAWAFPDQGGLAL
ncbi:host nuclease inhibitor protein [Methylorubrum populi]|uniref:host nuclease inhibitor protein n=1 Tax=Methylorubrum populi TaxID=223967 RepID=UPI0023550BB8|nr:host nuclease inhibitor protein [Methylorubrum populi]